MTSGTTAIQAVRNVTDTVPIVMAGGGDPVASGLVKSLSRPGGNITGVSLLGQELVPKGFSLLREVVPRAKRIDLMANAANPANAFFGRLTSEAGLALGVESRLLEVRRPEDLEPAITSMQADALLALADPMFGLHARRIADIAIKRRLPLASYGRAYVEAGYLMSYAVSFPDVFRKAAEYADRILQGANPAQLPIEQPARYELLFNLKTARALRLTIPQSLLQRADHIFE
ncbi:MAG: ABC transporter substrate-binding protein [Burkholderiales bacterium]